MGDNSNTLNPDIRLPITNSNPSDVSITVSSKESTPSLNLYSPMNPRLYKYSTKQNNVSRSGHNFL